jgi:hypothetical protein
MAEVITLPDRLARGWAVLWRSYCEAVRSEWGHLDNLDERLARCEAVVRPFFEELMAPIKFRHDAFNGVLLPNLPPEVIELAARQTKAFADALVAAWAEQHGNRVRAAVLRLAGEVIKADARQEPSA